MFGLGSSEIVVLIGVFLFFQWIIMLVDAIRRPSNLYKLGKKNVWVILLILLGQPTALVYYFTNRKENLIPEKKASAEQRLEITGCIKCQNLQFKYDSYSSEYICQKCGWSVKKRPDGNINII